MKCQRCGRPLRDPVSIACGLGPECREAQPSPRARRTAAFRAGQPVVIGEHTYRLADDGNWTDGEKVIWHFEDWLIRYRLIDGRPLAGGVD